MDEAVYVLAGYGVGIRLKDMLCASERISLDGVVELGRVYRRVVDWTRKVGQGGQGYPSAYMSAVCVGVEEVLDRYRLDLLELEQDIVSRRDGRAGDTVVNLAALQVPVRTWRRRLEPLDRVLMQLDFQDARVIDALEDEALRAGSEDVRSLIEMLLAHCVRAFAIRLQAWLRHGELPAHSQFFFYHPDDPIALEWKPGFVSMATAENIRIVGLASKQMRSESCAPPLSVLTKEFEHQLELINELDKRPLDCQLNLEAAARTLRSISDQILGRIILQADFLERLDAIKLLSLVASGHFWRCFLERSGALVDPPLVRNVLILARQSLSEVVAMEPISYTMDSDFFDLTLDSNDTVLMSCPKAIELTGGWSRLRPSQSVSWPVSLILSGDVMTRYARCFPLLLFTKRAVLQLRGAWLSLMRQSRVRRSRGFDVALGGGLHLCHQMLFVAENLEGYFQGDTVNRAFQTFGTEVGASMCESYEKLQLEHETFLSTVERNTFATCPQLLHSVVNLLSVINAFVISCHNRRDTSLSPAEAIHISRLGHDFVKATNTFLSRLREEAVEDQKLSSLLFRLDWLLTGTSDDLGKRATSKASSWNVGMLAEP